MNVKLLRKIKKHILAEPRRFKMASFIEYATPGTIVQDYYAPACPPQPIPDCGTAACIGGWAVILSGQQQVPEVTSIKAIRALKVEPEAGWILFETNNWPDKFRNAFRKAKTWRTKANVACRRIDHFIKTKGAE